MNSKTGRPERVFVNLEAVYPNPTNPSEEFSFDELRAAHRGWTGKTWASRRKSALQEVSGNARETPSMTPDNLTDTPSRSNGLPKKVVLEDNENGQQSESAEFQQSQSGLVHSVRQRRTKIKEVKQETQTSR